MQKYSKLFGKTIKDTPKDATTVSHQLLYRAGFIRESVAGRYFFLPLGMKVKERIMQIIEEEMEKAGAQKMITPILHPLELWEETNRDNEAGFELMRMKDRRGADFALGGTAEEMFVDVVRGFNLSYRDLPFNVYQFSQKFRDELRARGGLLRTREFTMKDAYSFHTDEEDFKKEYDKMANTYSTIFKRLGIPANKVLSDNGYIGGDYCHEYIVDSEVGESRYLISEDGTYSAHEDVAEFARDEKNLDEAEKDLEEVKADRGTTMEDGVELHGLPLWQQIKDVLFVDEKGRYILAIIRGDYDVNETKLINLTGSIELRHATEEEIREEIGSEPGFISPVGIKDNLKPGVELIVVADTSLRTIKNAYGGSNKKNLDLLNMNIDRDYKADIEGDIAMAQAGYLAPDKKFKLKEDKGIEVGNIFQLGYHYSKKMHDAVFTDQDGQEKPFYMGCYGIGIGRNMATIVEKHHDDKGLVWPKQVAPYDVHFITLSEKDESQAEEIIRALEAQGLTVLWDEREAVSAGEKFADADLIGIPARVILSKRSLDNGGVEVTSRKTAESKVVAIEKLAEYIETLD